MGMLSTLSELRQHEGLTLFRLLSVCPSISLSVFPSVCLVTFSVFLPSFLPSLLSSFLPSSPPSSNPQLIEGIKNKITVLI